NSGGGGWIDSVVEADKKIIVTLFRLQAAKFEKFSSEFRFHRADGSVRWGLSEGFPYYDTDGNYAGYAGSVTDITERKQDELRKNEFLAVASHELKTPITSIKAYTQLLASTYEKTHDAFLKNALTKVENQINKMSKLVSDFLNLSKIESDRFQLVREVFNMNDLVSEIVSDTQMVATSHIIAIITEGRADVLADREKISQVLANLLNNAVKYSPDEKDISVQINTDETHVTVMIHDRGIGIRPDEHDKIFQRFYRAGPNNIQFSGFGIGLYISAEIIRQHNGEIGVMEQTEKGSRLYFRLALAN
ncbi:MAG: PAS domain S-box protein, partial [Pedobacter sp.]